MMRVAVLGLLLLCFASGAAEAKKRVLHHDGRPSAWCGWFLSGLLGLHERRLWVASNWVTVGRSSGGPQVGAIVVWRHHVGLITGREKGQWIVKSGNDGGRVRERPRSVSNAIAFRTL